MFLHLNVPLSEGDKKTSSYGLMKTSNTQNIEYHVGR